MPQIVLLIFANITSDLFLERELVGVTDRIDNGKAREEAPIRFKGGKDRARFVDSSVKPTLEYPGPEEGEDANGHGCPGCLPFVHLLVVEQKIEA